MTPAIGDTVRVVGQHGFRGLFRVVGTAQDGSLTLWGGPTGHYAYRNVAPAACRRTRKAGPERIATMAAPATRKAGKR